MKTKDTWIRDAELVLEDRGVLISEQCMASSKSQ
jgi:hypothetical protein